MRLPADAAGTHVSSGVATHPTSAILGTPAYMAAPQQAKGQARPDWTANRCPCFRACFTRCLAGRTPFHADNVLETLSSSGGRAAAAFASLVPHLPAVFESICNRCLRKKSQGSLPECREPWPTISKNVRRQQTQSRHFARLTGLAAGVFVLLLVCQFTFFHWFINSRKRTIPDFSEEMTSSRMAPPSRGLDGVGRVGRIVLPSHHALFGATFQRSLGLGALDLAYPQGLARF